MQDIELSHKRGTIHSIFKFSTSFSNYEMCLNGWFCKIQSHLNVQGLLVSQAKDTS